MRLKSSIEKGRRNSQMESATAVLCQEKNMSKRNMLQVSVDYIMEANT